MGHKQLKVKCRGEDGGYMVFSPLKNWIFLWGLINIKIYILYLDFFLSGCGNLQAHEWYTIRYISVAAGDFWTRGCCPKITLHFLVFYFNLRFFCKFHRIRHNFGYFSNLTIDLKKYILRLSPQTDTASFLWVRVGVRN